MEVVNNHIFSGTEVSPGAAIIARTSLLTGQGHSFALLSCDFAMKESFHSRCSPGPDDIGDSQTLQSLSVPDIPEDPPPLSQVGDRKTDPAKLFPNLENETLMDQPLIVPPQLLPVNAGDEFSASMMEIAAASSSSGRLRRRAGSRRPSSGAR